MSAKPAKKGGSTGRPLSSNRKARHDFEIIEQVEAGVELRGTEVKSLRGGQAGLAGGFARFERGQLWLQNVNIAPYECGSSFNHDPIRPRRLLLHRKELMKLTTAVEQKGLTLVPLSMYFKGPWVKVMIGVCRGKTHGDKRETLRRKTADREAKRAMGQHRG